MMARKESNSRARPLRRRVAFRRPRKTLVIFCEGTRTEPEYLDALKRQPSVRDVAAVDIRIEAGPGQSAPKTLVSMAVEARSRAIDEEAEIDEFWCAFDVEWPRNHPGLREVVERARQNDIQLAISNPCFELWLILHFQDHNAWLDNDNARRLRRRLDGSADKGLNTARYMPLVNDAMRRAVTLDKRHLRNGTVFPMNNPSSGMHRFLVAIESPELSSHHKRGAHVRRVRLLRSSAVRPPACKSTAKMSSTVHGLASVLPGVRLSTATSRASGDPGPWSACWCRLWVSAHSVCVGAGVAGSGEQAIP